MNNYKIFLSTIHCHLCFGKPITLQSGKRILLQYRRCRRCGFDPWVGKTPLEEYMATKSSILAWRNPITEEPGMPQSIGLQSQTQLSD